MMTNIPNLVAFIILAAMNNSIAQDYKPFIENQAIWYVHSSDQYGVEEYCSFEFGKDTVLNNTLYKQVVQKELMKIQSGSFNKISESTLGYVREDEIARQVFFIKSESYKWGMKNCEVGQEFLLYDFDVNINDTLIQCNSIVDPDFPLTVNFLSSENIFGEERVIYCFDHYCETNRIIEGIGSDEGPFVDLSNLSRTADHFVDLIEYCEDKSMCEFTTSAQYPESIGEITIYPNPVTYILEIRGFNKNTGSGILYDIKGNKLIDFNPGENLDVSQLTSGLYLLLLKDRNGVQAAKFYKSN